MGERVRFLACVTLCSLTSGLALAEDHELPDANLRGLTLAAGVGGAEPWGKASKGSGLGDLISDHLLLTGGAGYRAGPALSLGVFFHYARPRTMHCEPRGDCEANLLRVGGELRYYFTPEQMFTPWFSCGGGWERLELSSDRYADYRTWTGWDVDLQLGGDFRVTSLFTLGPYFGLRVGRYGQYQGSDIGDCCTATHGWVAAGLRGELTLFGH